MTQLSKMVVATVVTTITALAGWPLTGTVSSIKQNIDGSIGVITQGETKSRTILSDDANKQAKLAMLLTAKTSGTSVTLEIDNGVIGYIILQ